MSNDITLSAGVRQNLLALQNTASLLSTTQERLATGKKVNSALDNPSNFFTSQSLSNRATDLNALLDAIGQAQQTLTTADQGITSLTGLVQSAKSIANQALQSPLGTVNYTTIAGTQAITDDTTQVTSTNTVAAAISGGAVASVQSSATLTAAGLAQLTAANDGQTLTFQLGSGTVFTATFTTGVVGANQFNTAAQLRSLLSTDFGSAATVSGTTGATVTSNDLSNDFTIGGTAAATVRTGAASDFAATAHSLGDALTITDAANHSANFYYVAGNASAANGTFSDIAGLVSAVNNAASNVHANITATNSSGALTLAATNSITVAGAFGTALGGVNGTANANYNATLASVTGTLTVQVGSNAAHSVSFGSGNGQVDTKAELTSALNGFTDITAGYDSTGHIQFTPQSTDNVTIGGTPSTVTALGLSTGVTTPTATVVTPNSTRANLQSQFNALLTQIDQLASDASYNGINLLNGDNLKVTFNENGSSSLTIQGVKFDSTGLGLSAISGNGFQDNHNIDTTVSKLDGALTSLRTQAAQFGSNLSTVQTRQDFTKNLINTLQTGSDNLVLADTNQEGANLLALQTRQQLAITSLSLASQADQAILKVI
jgi:flagellin-like hook-associated protein FlgL